jgi:excisionase family DNA binding protein
VSIKQSLSPVEQSLAAVEPLLLRPIEAAKAIGVSRAKAYDLIRRGLLPHVRIGFSVRVPVAALNRMIDAQLAAQQAGEVGSARPL